ALVQHFEGAPRGAVARDGVRGEPLAVDVTTEVDARVLAGVEIADGEAVHRRQLALVELERGIGLRGGVGLGGLFLLGAAGERGGYGEGQDQQFDARGYGFHGFSGPNRAWQGYWGARRATADSIAFATGAWGVEGHGGRPVLARIRPSPVREACRRNRLEK